MEQIDDLLIEWGQDDLNQVTLYKLDNLGGGDIELPSEFCHTITEVQDQRKAKYPNGCSCYSWSHIFNIIARFMKTTGDNLRTNAVENETGNPKIWRAMSLALAMFRRLLLTDWYASISKDNTYLIKKRIYEVGPLMTWSNKIDRVAMAKAKTKKAIIKSWPWHFFALVGWSDSRRVWIMRDSFWMLRGDWHFELSYEDINALFTLISMTTKEETSILKQNKDEIAFNACVAKWITSWKERDRNATRGEVAIMLGRLKYWLLSDTELLQKTKADGLWNGEGNSKDILREDVFTMLNRFVGGDVIQLWYTNGLRGIDPAKRWEVITMIGRIIISKEKQLI